MSGNGPPSSVDDGRSPVSGDRRREMDAGTKLAILGLVATIAVAFIWFNAAFRHKTVERSEAPAYITGGEAFQPPPADTTPAPLLGSLPLPPPQSGLLASMRSGQALPASAPIMASQALPS